MRARHPKSLLAAAVAALGFLVHCLEGLAGALLQRARPRRAREDAGTRERTPAHADERTARRIAEAQRGGVSSAESAARWALGDNPGGLHHKAVRHETPERLADEEPGERQERTPRGERHMPANRRG